MIVRLQNLSLRAPTLSDLHEIAELIMLCDTEMFDTLQRGKEAFTHNWHTPQFQLLTDAWLIATRDQHIVAYADVYQQPANSQGTLTGSLCIHPHYRHLGLGTLLLRLVEMRARQLMCSIAADLEVALQFVMRSNVSETREFFAAEGYMLTSQFWRVRINVPLLAVQTVKKSYRHGSLDIDVTMTADCSSETVQDQNPDSLPVLCQYDVYEKVLCPAKPAAQSSRTIPTFASV